MGKLFNRAAWGMVIVLAWAFPVMALAPDEILLLVNKNIPESALLADFYKTNRNIPEGRICSLALPQFDDISFAAYETDVVPALRDFLRQNKLENKVRCIVSFYGVPLRIGAHTLSADEQNELSTIQKELDQKNRTLADRVDRMEIKARQASPAFSPAAGTALPQLEQRALAALKVLNSTLPADPEERQKAIDFMRSSVVALGGESENIDNPKVAELRKKADETREEIRTLLDRRYNPQARAMIRSLADERLGLLEQVLHLMMQADYLKPEQSGAAFDSELSLLWWDMYARSSQQPNPYYYPLIGQRGGMKEILLTSRLDAPQSGLVRQMIVTSMTAERDGLKGRVALDGRGIKADIEKVGSFGWYDQSIRSLSALIRTKTKLAQTVDDTEELFKPNMVISVAMYCGWYSVRNYMPACRFNPGAVAVHVASYECISLRTPGEKGWCKGLIEDGAAATLGAVAEPYLSAFPRADDFFGLLMTGKITLAEAYWRTNPFASWQMTLLGDPLYTPYKNNPAIKVEDLPDRLKPIFKSPSTQPATRPLDGIPVD